MPVVTHLVSLSRPPASKRTSASSCGTRASATRRSRTAGSTPPARHASVHRRARRRRARARDPCEAPFGVPLPAKPAGAAHVALPPRARCRAHRRARDLESHAPRRSSRSTRSASGAAFTGSTAPRGTPGAKRSGALSRTRAARDRELDGGRTGAAAPLGLPRRRARLPQRAAAEPRAGRADAQALSARAAIKLGAAARLYPVKGLAIVLHAVASLRALRPPLDVELEVAGAGPELAAPRAVGRELGLAERGDVPRRRHDMRAFYGVSIVWCTRRSRRRSGSSRSKRRRTAAPSSPRASTGLAEAVADGVTGDCIAPTLPLARYVELGGALDGLAAVHLRSRADALVEPRAVDPERSGRGGRRRVRGRARLRGLSAAASAHVLAQPSFAAHVRDVMAVIDDSSGARSVAAARGSPHDRRALSAEPRRAQRRGAVVRDAMARSDVCRRADAARVRARRA